VKWSRPYERFIDATHPAARRVKQAERELFRRLVPSGSLCFDVGANIGDKTSMFIAHGCRVVAVEPVARNVHILRKRFGGSPQVTLVVGAVSDHVGREMLNVIDDNTSFSSFSDRWVASLEHEDQNRWGLAMPPASTQAVDTTTVDVLIEQYGRPFYLKVDVEGHEISVLRGMSQPIPLVSVEANLPEFTDETRACVSRLGALAPAAVFNYTNETQDRFVAPEWVGAAAFDHHLANTDERFMEIYCRMAEA